MILFEKNQQEIGQINLPTTSLKRKTKKEREQWSERENESTKIPGGILSDGGPGTGKDCCGDNLIR